MPTKTWVDGEDFLAPDINSYLQSQMVLSFANAADRAAEISNPAVGMVSYLASTGGFEVFTDKTTPSSWRPPWNTAWGLVTSVMVNDVPLSTSAQWIISQLPVQIAGRQYKIEYDVILAPTNLGFMEVRFQTQAALDTQCAIANYPGWSKRVELWNVYAGGPTITVGVIGSAWGDAITASMSWGRVRVFDVGPV